MWGYGDLKGVDDRYLEEIKDYKPFINFLWEKDRAKGINKKLILEKRQLDHYGENNILCFSKAKNFDEIVMAYKLGFRCVSFDKEIVIDSELCGLLNGLNIIIDALDLEFDTLENIGANYKSPIIISSGNSVDVWNCEKNLDKGKIKVVAESDGLIGININVECLNGYTGRENSFEAIFRHIDYIIELVGEDCVSFGCGFNSGNILPWEVQSPKDMKVLGNWLDVYYGSVVKEKIMFRNILRVLENVL